MMPIQGQFGDLISLRRKVVVVVLLLLLFVGGGCLFVCLLFWLFGSFGMGSGEGVQLIESEMYGHSDSNSNGRSFASNALG